MKGIMIEKKKNVAIFKKQNWKKNPLETEKVNK